MMRKFGKEKENNFRENLINLNGFYLHYPLWKKKKIKAILLGLPFIGMVYNIFKKKKKNYIFCI